MATDTNNATATDAVTVTVDSGDGGGGSTGTMTVGLSSDSTSQGSTWTAHATVLVTTGDPASVVSGATVTYRWNGAATTETCTTDSHGVCRDSLSQIHKSVASVTFTVDLVTHSSYADVGPVSIAIAKP